MIKSLEELNAVKEHALADFAQRDQSGAEQIRVVIGMATCGVAAGARPVMDELLKEVARRDLKYVSVVQTGCIGVCQYEPVMEVCVPGEEKVTYVKMSPEKVPRIVTEHLVNRRPVSEFTIGAYQK